MKKKKIEIQEMDGEIVVNVIQKIIQDSLIAVLIKKKIFTKRELQQQIQKSCKEMNKDMNQFIKENPGLVDQIQEEIRKKQTEQKEMGSYIG